MTRTTSKLTDSKAYGCNVVVGTDLDGDKVEDPRDFYGAAGHGARLNLRNPYDITTNPPRRLANQNPQSSDATADGVIYNHDLSGKQIMVPPWNESQPDF